MKLGGWGTNLALGFHLVHFIALRNNSNRVLWLLEPSILAKAVNFHWILTLCEKNRPFKTNRNADSSSAAELDATTLAPLKFERTSPGAYPQSSGLTAT